MYGIVHKEMVSKIIDDFKYQELKDYLHYNLHSKEQFKHWTDQPDNRHHYSKLYGEHSYKIEKKDGKIIVHKNKEHHPTVVSNLFHDTKNFLDWIVEKQPHTACMLLAKNLHWVVDVSSPPHTCYGWSSKAHGKFESKCDRSWRDYYKKAYPDKIKEKSIALWAVNIISRNYARNRNLLELTDSGVIEIGATIKDITQNVNDYLYYIYLYLKKKGAFEW